MSGSLSREDRRAIADRLKDRADPIAAVVTAEFLDRHPDWIRRYGDLARTRGIEDARFHLEYLAGALLSTKTAAFEDYARWTAGMLAARGIEPGFLIENLEQVAEHAAAELDEEGADEVRRMVAAGVTAIRSAPHAGPGIEPGDALAPARGLYLQAVLAGRREIAVTVAMEALRAGTSVLDIFQEILQPAQYEIGRLWERNEITVAREHTATALTQYVMARLYDHLPRPTTSRGPALVTGVRGELHQVGANMVADVLEADGWNMRFLGTQLPHRDILQAIEDHEPRVVGISATVLANLAAVSDLVGDLRRTFDPSLKIVVGGGAFRSDPDVWREIGADGFGRDLREARAVVTRLFPDG